MTRKEVIYFIGELEKKYPVDRWKIDDIDLWPIVKFNIFALWRAKQNVAYNALLTSVSRNPSFISLILGRAVSIFYFLKLLIKKKNAIPILFVGENAHRVTFEGKFVNRYFQPIIDILNNKSSNRSLVLEYSSKDPTKDYKSSNEIVFLDKYIFVIKILEYFRINKRSIELFGFEDFIREINIQFPGLIKYDDYLKSLMIKVNIIKRYAYLYDIFFRKYNPKYAMCLCYYTNAGYGMTYAAHKRNIHSVDMQHGGQGILHPSYSGYSRVPKQGFNTLPKIFWCWDKASANNIEIWASLQSFHEVVVGGNPWLSYFLAKNNLGFSFPRRKIILYTLQLNEPEEYIIEAIKRSPSEYQWWLRLHPRTLGTREHIEDLLKRNNIFDKVEIEKATSYPLPHILKNAVVHITRSSGSAIEAAQLGIKTILINEIGVENYAEYIENGDAFSFLNESSGELIDLIAEIELKTISLNDTIPLEITLMDLLDKN